MIYNFKTLLWICHLIECFPDHSVCVQARASQYCLVVLTLLNVMYLLWFGEQISIRDGFNLVVDLSYSPPTSQMSQLRKPTTILHDRLM